MSQKSDRLLSLIRTNAGLLLLSANIILFIILFFLYDPLGIVKKSYADTKPILGMTEKEIREIQISDPEDGEVKIILKKGNPIPTGIEKPSRKDRSLKESHQLKYEWKFIISDKTGPSGEENHLADRERLSELFEDLGNARRYYSIRRTPEKDRELDMGKSEKGEPLCTTIRFIGSDAKENTLYLGRSKGSNSYIRLNDENEIYLVQSNLKISAGGGDRNHFRNRRIFPGEWNQENTVSLLASFNDGKRNVELSRVRKDWQMLKPIASAGNQTAVSSLVTDILEWKASSFPTKPAPDLDKKFALHLSLSSTATVGGLKSKSLDILGKRGHSSYIIRDENGILYEITSSALNDLYNATSRLVARDDEEKQNPFFKAK